MDLTRNLMRIDAWTRQMLDSEAEKRGITHPERRSRAELMTLIARHDYEGGMRNLDGAIRVVSSVLESAARVLPGPRRAFDRLRARLPLSAAQREPDYTQRSPQPTSSVPRARSGSGGSRPAARASARAPSGWQAPAPSAGAATAAVGVSAPNIKTNFYADEVLPTPSPSSAGATTRSFVEEPIRTHSMARLLATQGHKERALVIYEELLAKNSADAALAKEADAVRHGRELTFAIGELPAPPKALRTPLPTSRDSVACERRGDTELLVRWQITPEGEARARSLLGGGGELTLRVVVIRPDAANVVSSEITEHGPIPSRGEWTTQRNPHGTRSFASVGVRAKDRFVSIIHSAV